MFKLLEYVNLVLNYFFTISILPEFIFIKDFQCYFLTGKLIDTSVYRSIWSFSDLLLHIKVSFKLVQYAILGQYAVKIDEILPVISWKYSDLWIMCELKGIDLFSLWIVKFLFH